MRKKKKKQNKIINDLKRENYELNQTILKDRDDIEKLFYDFSSAAEERDTLSRELKKSTEKILEINNEKYSLRKQLMSEKQLSKEKDLENMSANIKKAKLFWFCWKNFRFIIWGGIYYKFYERYWWD